jgi:hypothetical protein
VLTRDFHVVFFCAYFNVRLFFTVDRGRKGGIQPLSTVKKSRTT